MRKKLLIAAVALVIVITVPAVLAALQQSQAIHVSKTYTNSIPTTIPSPSSTANPSGNIATVKFSLFFPNGSTYVMSQNQVPSIYGATNLDVNGIPVNVQSNLGAPPSGYVAGVIILRNDGNVLITVNATLTNVNVPSDIELTLLCTSIKPANWGNQLDGWMGANNLATGNIVEVGQYVWLSIMVTMSSNAQGSMGVIRNHASFSYAFDAIVTAVQA